MSEREQIAAYFEWLSTQHPSRRVEVTGLDAALYSLVASWIRNEVDAKWAAERAGVVA